MGTVSQLLSSPLLIAALAATLPVLAVSGTALLRARPTGEARVTSPLAAEAARPALVTRLLDRAGRRLTPAAMRLFGERQVAATRWRLEAAGRPRGYTVEAFMGRRAVLTVAGLGCALFMVAQGNPLGALGAVVSGALLMDVWLSRILRTRQAAIERALPDFLDILAITITAGLSFRQALDRIADAVPGPLSEEIRVTLRQMEIGVPRRQALEQLRDRNQSPTLASFVTALLQGEELGAPLAATLTDLAAELRRTWAQQARRRAARAEPQVSLVLSMVIGPASVLLIAAGMLLDLFDLFRGENGVGSFLGS